MKFNQKLSTFVRGAVATGTVWATTTSVASAATIGNTGFNLGGTVGSTSNSDPKTTVANIANTIISYALFLAGIVAVIFLIYYGFQYVTAGGDADKVKKARAGIVNAIIGIIVILISVAIVNLAGSIGGGLGNSISNSTSNNGTNY